MKPSAPKFFTPQDLAEQWGVHRKTVLRAIRRGDLPAVRIGPQTIRVTEVDAAIFYAKRASGVPARSRLSSVAPGRQVEHDPPAA